MAEKWVTAEHEIRSCGGKNWQKLLHDMISWEKNKEQFLWNLSINRERHAQGKKKKRKREERTEGRKKKGRYRKREQIHTQQRHRENKKERHRQREQHKAKEKYATQVCIRDFTSPFLLYLSFSLPHSQIIIFVW